MSKKADKENINVLNNLLEINNPSEFIKEILNSKKPKENKNKGKKQELIEEDNNYSLSSFEEENKSFLIRNKKNTKSKNNNIISIKNNNHKSIEFKNIKKNDLNYKINLLFPFEPYETQKKYMKTLLQAFSNKKNSILESPTGTGKTLVLLTSSLAYLENERKNGNKDLKILYLSRTHYQLKQVIDELKNCAYKPKMSILGGREHLCTNKDLRKLKSYEKNIKCEQLVRQNNCVFYKNFEKGKQFKLNDVFNIEEIMNLGIKKKICTYFHSKKNLDKDIIFLPYNYCLNFFFRKINKDLFKNSIIIFDEAHNLPSKAEESSSLSISLEDICNLINFLKEIIEKFEIEKDLEIISKDVLQHFEELKKNLVENYFNEKKNFSKIKKGELIFYILESLIKEGRNIKKDLKRILKETETIIKIKNRFSIEKIKNFLDLTIKLWKDSKFEKQQKKQIMNFRLNIEKKENNLNLNLWCLSPSFAFKEIEKIGIHSIILTSGTLSPIKNFIKELDIDFDYIYKGNHVINTKKQLFSSVLTKYINNDIKYNINFSYNNRGNSEMISFIGEQIFKICKIVKEGILVFFPSYYLMESYFKNWKDILKEIKKEKKIFKEIKGKENNKLIEKYKKIHKKGAIFFAVCNGKLSEGVDFSDSMARACIVLGIPFPNFSDLRIKEKKNFVTENNRDDNSYNGNVWYKNKGMRAANQAMGRVIRHKNDYGAIILLDYRFYQVNNKKYISSWIKNDMKNYSDPEKFLHELESFFRGINPNSIENYFSDTKTPKIENSSNNSSSNSNSNNGNFFQNRSNNNSNNGNFFQNRSNSSFNNDNFKSNNYSYRSNNKFNNDNKTFFRKFNNDNRTFANENHRRIQNDIDEYKKNDKYFKNINIETNNINSSSYTNNFKTINIINNNINIISQNSPKKKKRELNEDELKSLLGSFYDGETKNNFKVDEKVKNKIEIFNFSIFSNEKKIILDKKIKQKIKKSPGTSKNFFEKNYPKLIINSLQNENTEIPKVNILNDSSQNENREIPIVHIINNSEQKNQAREILEEKYQCKICYEENVNIFLASKCGHIACKKCWYSYIKKKKECLYCRKQIKNVRSLRKVYLN